MTDTVLILRITSGERRGQGYPIPASGLLIGRDGNQCQVVLEDQTVSRVHCRIGFDEKGRVVIEDRNSKNGTFVNGKEITRAVLAPGDEVGLGKTGPKIVLEVEEIKEIEERPTPLEEDVIHITKDIVTIGRAKDNDIILDYPQVSRYHAKIVREDKGLTIYDLGSTNGTFINGKRIESARISLGDRINLGSYTLYLEKKERFSKVDYRGNLRLEACEVTKEVKDRNRTKRLIEHISFTALPSEFVGLIGPSGCGKTTLMNVLAGYDRKADGMVLINDLDLFENYDSFRGNIGYVPQDDIIHQALTVYKSLYYTAKLRLPEDTSEEEINRQVFKVLKELKLEEAKDVRIGNPLKKGISGGQRKRVNLGQELITEPSIMFLDEPTSGLDPKSEREVMALLKDLAKEGRVIILTTHNINKHNFETISNVAILYKGRLVYYGPGREATEYFNTTDDPVDVFTKLEEQPAEHWERDFKKSQYYEDYVAKRSCAERPSKSKSVFKEARTRKRGGLRQWWILTRRYLEMKLNDTAATLVMLLQAPIIAFLVGMMFRSKEAPYHLATLLFVLSLAALWFGASNAAREIVSELSIYRRERMVNLKIPSYVLSKVGVLSLVSTIQCFILAGGSYLLLSGKTRSLIIGGIGDFILIFLILLLTAMVGIMLGLLLSSLLSSPEGAIGLVPIVLIPQILFGGTVMRLSDMAGTRWLADLMISRWSLQALARVIYESNKVLSFLYEKVGATAHTQTWGIGADIGILALFAIVFMIFIFISLKSKDIR